jgi:hypothetical protein
VALAVAAIGLTLAIGWILYPPRGGQAPAPRVAPGAEVAPPQAPDVDAPPVDAAPGRAMAAPATPSAELSDLRIDGHMVVPQRPELNRVFVAGRAVRLGEALAPGILLLEVQPGIAVVDHRGERHELQIR